MTLEHFITRACWVGALMVFLLFASCSWTPSAQQGASGARLSTPGAGLYCFKGSPAGPASGARWQTPPAPTSPPQDASGAIAGHVSYPADGIFPQLVYAISVYGPASGAYSTETVTNQATYTIDGMAPGTYFVYSTVRPLPCITPGAGIFAAGYTEFVKCGLDYRCRSHQLIPVTVRSNATTQGIDPEDWYGSQPNFAPPPAGIVPPHPKAPVSKPPFGSARAAAVAIATEREAALVQDTLAGCPRNRACLTIGVEHDGSNAAYFVGAAGSNAINVSCAAYVYKDSSGWRALRWHCGAGIFPAVGGKGIVFLGIGITSGCVNVRKSPGSAGAIVGCLKYGTHVTVDGGPVYAPLATMDGTWWHVAGLGWMADDFLR